MVAEEGIVDNVPDTQKRGGQLGRCGVKLYGMNGDGGVEVKRVIVFRGPPVTHHCYKDA